VITDDAHIYCGIPHVFVLKGNCQKIIVNKKYFPILGGHENCVIMAIPLDQICRTCMSTGVLLSIFDCSQENSKDAVYEMLRAIDIPVSHLRFFLFTRFQSSSELRGSDEASVIEVSYSLWTGRFEFQYR
jgi:hypothetical protein